MTDFFFLEEEIFIYFLLPFFQIVEELNNQKKELQTAMSLLHMEELKCRKRVLRRLGYATEADVIEMKGRVACELSK